MSDPYRPLEPPPNPELLRLAQQGQQRRAALAAGSAIERDESSRRHLKTAIGAYRGSTLHRVVLAVMLLGALSLGLGIMLSAFGQGAIGVLFMPGAAITFVGIFVYVFVPPTASEGAIAAEQAWLGSLPFALQGYFEALSARPSGIRTLSYDIIWQDGTRAPDPALVHGVFCAVEADACLDRSDSRHTHITAGQVSGVTGIRINRKSVYRNHRIPARVHAVVERALLPLHRSHPIARVELRG